MQGSTRQSSSDGQRHNGDDTCIVMLNIIMSLPDGEVWKSEGTGYITDTIPRARVILIHQPVK